MSAFSKKNMIFCPLFPRKYAAKVQQKNQKNKQIRLILHKLAEFSSFLDSKYDQGPLLARANTLPYQAK